MGPLNRSPRPERYDYQINFPIKIHHSYESLLHKLGYFVAGRGSQLRHVGDCQEIAEVLFYLNPLVGTGGEELEDDLYTWVNDILRDYLRERKDR